MDESRLAVEAMLRKAPALVTIEHAGDELECSLSTAELLDEAQLGYAVAPDGTSLVGATGAWQANWLVVGYETLCGDPIFVDLADERLPVFTAPHGMGVWTPTQVASSLAEFLKRATRSE